MVGRGGDEVWSSGKGGGDEVWSSGKGGGMEKCLDCSH